MIARLSRLMLACVALAMLGAPLQAQNFSDSYKFLDAVKKSDGNKIEQLLTAAGGSTLVNSRDISTGETALHIVVNRGDSTYVRYLLAKGADPNLADNKGNTPVMIAVAKGQSALIPILATGGANINSHNSTGDSPLIIAVHLRNVTMVRALLKAGANPDDKDYTGRSARDYAKEDTRGGAIAKLIEETPVRAKRAISGPKL